MKGEPLLKAWSTGKMFPQFGATAETLSKASTMVFRFGTDAHLYDDPEDVNIAPLLDSRFDTEKYQALKRLLALIAQGFDVSNFFPQVVKNVASQSLEVKKLVYLYLLHYAERRPNEALLSINCFQKDLGDTNPLVRAWALRAMAGIRLHVISPLMLVALAKCARDPSVYVRKCAANALPKLNDLRQEENASAIEEIVGILLSDHSPGVVGSAAAAFASVCPNNLPLIGRNYRRLCEVLPDVEEWGQIALIGILLHYVIARHGLVKESIMFPTVAPESQPEEAVSIDDKTVSNEDDFEVENMICKSEVANIVSRSFIEGPDEYLSHSSFKNKGPPCLELACFVSGESNEDIKILLQCTSPLLWSHNSAVVLAAAGVHWIMGPVKALKIIARPLLFLLRSSNASKYVVLCNIRVFAKAMPPLFATYYEDFFVCSLDSYQIKALKLEILSSIATKSSIAYILQEFQEYIRDPDRRFAADTVAAIGLCAQKLTEVTDTCLEGLLALMMQESLNSDFASDDGKGQVLIQAIISIKAMIKLDPPRHEMVIIQLVRSLDSIKVSAARAMIIWIIGQYNSSGPIIQRILTTVLHYLAHCFTLEAMETKLQILNTTVKILLCAKGDDFVSYKGVLTYVIELAKCDMHYDIRDRARMVEKFLLRHLDSEFSGNETISRPQDRDLQETLSKCIFGTVTKLPPPDSTNNRFYLPGSLSQIVLHAAPGYEPLPKPCSLPAVTLSKCSEASYRTKDSLEETVKNGEDESEFSDESSSQHSITDYSGTGGSDETGSASEGSNNDSPLIMMADNKALKQQNDSDSLGDLMLPRKTLESWLDEQPGLLSLDSSQESQIQRSARISIGNFAGSVKPRTYSLLNPENSHGLRVDCSFSSEISSLSPQLVCVELSFKNCSAELISKIVLVEEESDRGADSSSESGSSSFHSEAVAGLEPGQTARRIVQVHFHHHLLPLKLVLWCDGKKLPLKLRPDIGYFVRPFLMDVVAFEDTESRLRGMFECTRRCTFTDHMEELNNVTSEGTQAKDMFVIISTRLALKMACNSNVSLVSVDLPVGADLDDASGLRLRFSSEMLQNLAPCLITITVEGKCIEPLDLSVKINCEEAVFGLNLLNGIVNFLVDTSLSNLK